MAALKRVTWQERNDIVQSAIRAACEARDAAECDDESPVSIYDVCEKLKVPVRFVPINMEGMFRRPPNLQIMISAFRPVPRQAFTCAHELGHYWLGHGAMIDEMKEANEQYDGRPPEEIAADAFAAAILMPTIGLRYVMALRGAEEVDLTPETVYKIACDFGVGYDTLIRHLQWGIREITDAKAKQLRLSPPKALRKAILGYAGKEHMLMVDAKSQADTMDTFVGSHIVAPTGSNGDETGLQFVEQRNGYTIFQITNQGVFELIIAGRDEPMLIRGTAPNHSEDDGPPEHYVGLARYRHLDQEEDDD